MASLVIRARDYVKTDGFKKLWRYSSVLVISTVLTNSLLFLFYDVIALGTAMECNIIATCITTAPAYYLNRNWTWGKNGKSHVWKEIVPFWVISFLSLVLSTVAVGIAAHNADRISDAKTVRSLLVVGANLVTYGSIWVLKFIFFNKYLFTHTNGHAGAIETTLADTPAEEQTDRTVAEVTAG